MDSDSSTISDEDDEDLNKDSIFLKPKCKYTKEKFIQSVRNGEITPFYQPSPQKTYLNDIMCELCYNFFPRVNKLNCCKHAVCSNCVIFIDKCPMCRKDEISITANCASDQFPDNNKNYPDDTLKIAEELKLDKDRVKKLLESGFIIDDLFNDDAF